MLVEYLKYKSPVIQPIEDRIRFADPLRDCDNGNGRSSEDSLSPLHALTLMTALLPLNLF